MFAAFLQLKKKNRKEPNPEQGIHLPKLGPMWFGGHRGKTNEEMKTFFIILILFLYIYVTIKVSPLGNVSPFLWVSWHTRQMCLGSAHPSSTPSTHTLPVLVLITHLECDLKLNILGKKASPKAHSCSYKEDTFFFHYIKAWIVHLQTNNHSFPWQNK